MCHRMLHSTIGTSMKSCYYVLNSIIRYGLTVAYGMDSSVLFYCCLRAIFSLLFAKVLITGLYWGGEFGLSYCVWLLYVGDFLIQQLPIGIREGLRIKDDFEIYIMNWAKLSDVRGLYLNLTIMEVSNIVKLISFIISLPY